MGRSLFLSVVLAMPLLAQDLGSGPNQLSGNFESGSPGYNPWGGVDDSGYIHVWSGKQLAVNDDGKVEPTFFSPSIAVGDLNGDGLPDLVVADARGFFWFFPNSGKPDAPAFTHGEVIPVWLDAFKVDGDGVPRIQLVDYTGEHKLSLIGGNYVGQLYFIHNQGTPTQPSFSMPQDHSQIEIATHTDGLLWCNYMSPFLYDWTGGGRLDLLMGDGSYSANSIYLFTNQGSNNHPLFTEQRQVKVIPGMGREDLTPQVVDWNNDGKPDIIAGERTGYIDLYLNQAANKTDPPVFDKNGPRHVLFGGTERVGNLTTVCVADLNHDGLFDLLVGGTDGRIFYSLNTGTPGAPKFGPLIPLKGVYSYKNIIMPNNWEIPRFAPYGSPYELIECTNAQMEPGFTPPPKFSGTGALKFSVVDPHAVYFKDKYVPPPDKDDTDNVGRVMHYTGPRLDFQVETDYVLSFWARTHGPVSNFRWRIMGSQMISPTQSREVIYHGADMAVGELWNRVSSVIRIPSRGGKPNEKVECSLDLICQEDGALYLDDIAIRKAAK